MFNKREYFYVYTAVVGGAFFGILLVAGIQANSFNDLSWWTAMASVVVLVGALLIIGRRRFP